LDEEEGEDLSLSSSSSTSVPQLVTPGTGDVETAILHKIPHENITTEKSFYYTFCIFTDPLFLQLQLGAIDEAPPHAVVAVLYVCFGRNMWCLGLRRVVCGVDG
jgi:hypothetical protein